MGTMVSVLMELRVLNCILRATNKLVTVPGRKVTCLNVTFRELYLSVLWEMDWRR